MATQSMPPSAPPQGAPAGAPGGDPEDTSSDYTICITVSQANGISVSVEPGDGDDDADDSGAAANGAPPSPDGTEGGSAAPGEDDDGAQSQSVPDIKSAIQLVLQIYQAGGEQPDSGNAQADMQSGYGS